MARIATIQKKEDLASEHQPVYDAIAASRGVVGGPFVALLHSPELAQRTAHLGSYVRFESSLDKRLIELTALATARELDCKHEWIAHVNHAQKAGIPIETVRAIYQKKGPEHFSSEDAQIISYVQELLRTHRASEATFQALYGRLGEKGLVELTATVGYYAMVACTLNAFDLVTATGAEEFKIG
ncbi:MAG TPA: carboxymuconolactone decarboxylase family protein [Candidatus Binatia bacterium]|nr:carboxymuconolactone decarboxylase family protein [Candidatus Binatia bacterium]